MKSLFRSLFSFSKHEVDAAFSGAVRVSSRPGLRLLSSPTGDAEVTFGKLLIVVPKKSGKASRRNRIRRQIRAIFFQEHLYHIRKTWVLLVYKEAMELSFDEITTFLKESIS